MRFEGFYSLWSFEWHFHAFPDLSWVVFACRSQEQLRRLLEDSANDHQDVKEQAMDDYRWQSPGQEAVDKLRRDRDLRLMPEIRP